MKQKEAIAVFGKNWKPLTISSLNNDNNENNEVDVINQNENQFQVESLYQDLSCITPKYILPNIDDIFSFLSLSSSSSKFSLNKNENSFYISPNGILFSTIVIGTFLYSTFKPSKFK